MIDVIRRYWTLKNNRQQKAHIKWAIQRYWYTLIDIKITIYGGERGILLYAYKVLILNTILYINVFCINPLYLSLYPLVALSLPSSSI